MPRKPAPSYQGKPCKLGHDGERYAANDTCVQCARERRARTYDRVQEAAYKRDYRARQRVALDAAAQADFAELL